jgi:hypothetical protein
VFYCFWNFWASHPFTILLNYLSPQTPVHLPNVRPNGTGTRTKTSWIIIEKNWLENYSKRKFTHPVKKIGFLTFIALLHSRYIVRWKAELKPSFLIATSYMTCITCLIQIQKKLNELLYRYTSAQRSSIDWFDLESLRYLPKIVIVDDNSMDNTIIVIALYHYCLSEKKIYDLFTWKQSHTPLLQD